MSLLDEIKAKAKSLKKTIVLCEGEDSRVVEAAAKKTLKRHSKKINKRKHAEFKKFSPHRKKKRKNFI